MLGGAVGLSIGEVIIASLLPRKLATIPNITNLGFDDNISALNEHIGKFHLIPVRTCIFVSCLKALISSRTLPFVMRCYMRGHARLQRYGW